MQNSKKKYVLIVLLFVFISSLNAQDKLENKYELAPYFGLSTSVGDFSNLNNSGFNAGLSFDRFLNSKFALGLDLNFQSLSSANQNDIGTFLEEGSINSFGFGNTSIFNFGLGPKYRIGQNKFFVDLYTRAGLSFISVPDSNLQLAGTSNVVDVFRTESQNITSFSLLSGVKFNYQVNDKISLSLSPQYLFSGKQIETFQRQINENADPQSIEQDAGKLCYTRPTTFNVNAGISIALGNKTEEVDSVENIPTCDLGFQLDCDGENPIVILDANWSFASPSDILVYSLAGPSASGITISPNSQPLGSSAGGNAVLVSFPNSAGGTTVTAKIELKNAAGTFVKCAKSMTITLPVCKPDPKPCDLEVDIRPCEYNSSTVGLSLTANWTNMPANATVNISLFDNLNTPISPSPISIPGNPYTIPTNGSGSYTFNPRIDVGAYEGTTIKAKMEICFVGPNGQNRCCEKEIDIEVPTCCYDCEGVSITDTTPPNQEGDGFFKVLWNLAPITGASIERMTVRLESFGADDLNTTVLPTPNFEISGAGFFPTPTPGYTSKPIGSLSGKRSNFWVIDFNSPITSGNFISIIDVYDRKVLRNYRLKIVLFNTDGKRCTQYLTFNN